MDAAQAFQKIPRIIHQTWKTRDIPARWLPLQKTWKDNHPDWEYRFTTDEDNRNFIAENYPWFLSIYDAYPLEIFRSDAFRYFVVYHYGGVYVDLDFESLRPLEGLLHDRELGFATEPLSHSESLPVRSRGFDRIICNAFLATVPRHPFWEHVQRGLVEHRDEPSILDATGVCFFTRAWDAYSQDKPHSALLLSELIYPIDYVQSQVSATRESLRARVSPEAYAIHYWNGSWRREAILESIHRRIKRPHNQRDSRI